MLSSPSVPTSPVLDQCTALVAGRSPLIRAGIVTLLGGYEIEVICEARETDEFTQKALARRPDLIVLCDVGSQAQGVEFLDVLSDCSGEHTDLLIITNRIDVVGASHLMSGTTNGFGYVLVDKIHAVDDFRNIVSRVVAGESVVDPDVINEMLGRKFRRDRFAHLTIRESQALKLMATGLTNRAIAERMTITTRAAEKHVGAIFEKLDLDPAPDNHRRVLAVLQFLQAR